MTAVEEMEQLRERGGVVTFIRADRGRCKCNMYDDAFRCLYVCGRLMELTRFVRLAVGTSSSLAWCKVRLTPTKQTSDTTPLTSTRRQDYSEGSTSMGRGTGSSFSCAALLFGPDLN